MTRLLAILGAIGYAVLGALMLFALVVVVLLLLGWRGLSY